jgi:epoxyqueuosine reductase
MLGIRYPKPPDPYLLVGNHLRKGGLEQKNRSVQIASYAWSDDYHDVLPDRLRAIVSFIETQIGEPIPNRWYTDTGPILEREFAQRAGLGWIGKNTCLINQRMGSYFFLAEILLGIELQTDEPIQKDHCGSCTRCLDHCPTGCIASDRTIDANRCISYLTIEHKGMIPEDLRPMLGTWIFGCDVCQQVCPWNQKFATAQHDVSFSPRPGIQPESTTGELSLTPKEFNRKFKGSPIKRTKRRGYLRNLAVAFGNQRHPAAYPALIAALEDFEPLIRGHAAWALGRTETKDALPALERALLVETVPDVVSEIKAAILLLA